MEVDFGIGILSRDLGALAQGDLLSISVCEVLAPGFFKISRSGY